MLHAKPIAQDPKEGWDETLEPGAEPLTREQARQWRLTQPALSPWRVVGVQCVVGAIAGLLAWVFTQSVSVTQSVLYGAIAVVLPAALMAYGLTSSALSRLLSGHAQAAFAGFLFWEGMKILASVALLAAAPWVVPQLNGIALLVGLVLVLKVYWFGQFLHTRRQSLNG